MSRRCGGELRSSTDTAIWGKTNHGKIHTGVHGHHKEDGAWERARGGRGSPENEDIAGGNGGQRQSNTGSLAAMELWFVGAFGAADVGVYMGQEFVQNTQQISTNLVRIRLGFRCPFRAREDEDDDVIHDVMGGARMAVREREEGPGLGCWAATCCAER